MQLKNLYPSLILGFATVMALTACSEDNSNLLFANNPIPGAENSVPGNSQPSTDTTVTPQPGTDSSAVQPGDTSATLPPTDLSAEGPITMPAGLGTLVDDFEDGDNLSKIGDYWYLVGLGWTLVFACFSQFLLIFKLKYAWLDCLDTLQPPFFS